MIRRVGAKASGAAIRYLMNDDPLLNAFAIYRLQNHSKNSWLYLCETRGSPRGYLSILPSAGADDVWVTGESKHAITELLTTLQRLRLTGRHWRAKRLYVNSDPRYETAISESLSKGLTKLQDVMIARKEEELLRANSTTSHVVQLGPNDATMYAKFVLPKDWKLSQQIIDTNRELLRKGHAFAILDKQGRIASTANVVVALPHVWVISSVETRIDSRRRGFGTAVVKTVLERAFMHGSPVMLYVDHENHTAVEFYRGLGFRRISSSICTEIGDFGKSVCIS